MDKIISFSFMHDHLLFLILQSILLALTSLAMEF